MEMETCFAKNKRERKKKERRIAQKKPLDKHNFCLQFLFTLTLMSKLE